MDKIKIAYLIDSLNMGGAQKLILDICKNIDKNKFDIYLIFWRKGGFYEEFKRVKDLRLIELKNSPADVNMSLFKKIPIFIRQYNELKEIVKKEKFAIIHSHLLFPDIHNSLLKRKFKNIISVSTKHSMGFFDKKRDIPLGKIIDARLDYLTACSNSVNKIFKKFNPNIKTIYNAIDLDEIKNTKPKNYNFVNQNYFNIISIGRLTKLKGFDHLIKTFNLFNKKISNSRLFICGIGEKQAELESMIKELKLENKVYLLGERNDVYSLMKSCDLFMLLSNWEGFGIVFLEAMACKLPVIGSNVGGIKEIIKDGKNGYLVNRFRYQRISNLMDKLKNNKHLREKLSKEGLKTVKSKFDINNIIKEYEKLYFKLIDKNG